MGALTLKSFPFELRGWDIEKFESIDPTDGFGTNTRVYISKQQIVQIEPDHSEMTSNPWLTDKGRQFFDGIFGVWNSKDEQDKNFVLKKESWHKTIQTLLKTLYLFEHCTAKAKTRNFFTIVFENLEIETLSLLKVIEQKYSFVKLRRAENLNIENDLESNFQITTASNPNRLKSSTLSLLVATNSRYEGYRLNLMLRQRYLKGNFNCLTLGSNIDLTFPNLVIGTNFKVLKEIAEGNNFTCQDFKNSTNPLIIFGSEFFKRTDNKSILQMLKYGNLFRHSWNGLNILNSTLAETGTQSIDKFLPLKKKDFEESSSFYLINVNAQNLSNFTKIAETKLLNYSANEHFLEHNVKKLFFDQNSNIRSNQNFARKSLQFKTDKTYAFLPVKMFFENERTFLNTEGFFKRTSKLITRRKTRDGWKLLRNLLSNLKDQYTPINYKEKNILSFSATKQSNFSKFINLHFCAVEKLDSLTPFFVTQNQPFFISHQNFNFKQKLSKIHSTKSKYWLDDFFTGGKDEYSKNSLVLSNSSRILRTQSTNFF